MRSILLLLLAGAFCLVLVAACGDDDDTTPTPSASPTSDAGSTSPTSDATSPAQTAEPTGPAAPSDLLLPVTTLKATLSERYHTGQAESPSVDQPVAAKIDALWYQSLGRYVVYYAGLSLETAGPLCPGNSIKTESGFEYVSNAPTEEGACTGAPNLAKDPAGVKVCDGKVLYLTEIPVDAEGTLYGSIEVYREDGSIVGETSQTPADAAAAPEIELSSCSDAVS